MTFFDYNDPVPQVYQDFFHNDSVVRFDTHKKIEQMIEDGVPVIGRWSRESSQYHPIITLHEMCHFVEATDQNTRIRSWGMRFGGYNIYEVPWDVANGPKTKSREPAWREMRVWAYTKNLCRQFSYDPACVQYGDSVYRLSCHYPGLVFEPYGRDKSEQVQWIDKEIERWSRLPQYSYESWKKEWDRKHEVFGGKIKF